MKLLKLLILLGLLNLTVYGNLTAQDTVKISLKQYRIMSTCPVILNECEELRACDSIEISHLKIDLNDKNETITEQRQLIKKVRKNVVISFCVGLISGCLVWLFV